MDALRENTRLCSVCYKMCRDLCSVAGATRHEADTPSHRAFFARRVLEGKETLTREIAGYFYRCSLCKACREGCETGLDTGDIMLTARGDLDPDLLPAPLQAAQAKIRAGAYYGPDSAAVRAALAPRLKSTAGALICFGRRLRAGDGVLLARTLALLERLGIDCQVLNEEPDTGQLAHFLGFTREARAQAEGFARGIATRRPSSLVVCSADDLRMIIKEYPRLGVEVNVPKIQSLPEFLREAVRDRQSAFAAWNAGTVTYHDACGLGREARVFEAPRELLRMIPGLELKEMAYTRDQAPCCGNGMGLEIVHPEITRLMARRLVAMARETGAQTLVLGCPTCLAVLKAAMEGAEPSANGVELLDLVSLLERMLA